MARPAYFIRRQGYGCSLVKLLPDGGEEVLEQGLTLAEAEVLYFICIGEPVYEAGPASVDAPAESQRVDARGNWLSSSDSLTRPDEGGVSYRTAPVFSL